MLKVNQKNVAESEYKSPKGKFQVFEREISLALGRDPKSPDLSKRHPFDLSLVRVPPGTANWPYHIESAQWELYVAVSGRGTLRHADGTMELVAGDSVMCAPGEAHQIINSSEEDFVYYVIADNPEGDSCYYPDSNKWGVRIGSKSSIIKPEAAGYFDGEE